MIPTLTLNKSHVSCIAHTPSIDLGPVFPMRLDVVAP